MTSMGGRGWGAIYNFTFSLEILVPKSEKGHGLKNGRLVQ